MQFIALGALSEVTGSCYLLHNPATGQRILIDCGAFQGGPDANKKNVAEFPFDPASIDYVILTHAHLDHCGRLPQLAQAGFKGTVLSTQETEAIARVVLADACKLNDIDPRWIDELKWRSPNNRLFKKPWIIDTDFFCWFHRSGHIMGAVSVEIAWGSPSSPEQQGTILFSGDLGNNRRGLSVQPWIKRRMVPSRQADWAVMESTYGGRARAPEYLDADQRRERLGAAIREAFASGDTVIIPVFAVQRCHDVLYDLHLMHARGAVDLEAIELVVDAPMARRTTEAMVAGINRKFTSPTGKVRTAWLSKQAFRDLGLDPDDEGHSKRLRKRLAHLLRGKNVAPNPIHDDLFSRFRPHWRPATNGERRHNPVGAQPRRIVLATGGMCAGGPVQSWLRRHLGRAESSVLLTGYCAEGTPGARFQQAAGLEPQERARLEEEITLDGASFQLSKVAATVTAVGGYSGHADQAGLLRWALDSDSQDRPCPIARRLIVTHGDDTARSQLQRALVDGASERGVELPVLMPAPLGPGLDLTTGEAVSREEVLGVRSTATPTQTEEWGRQLRELREVVEDLAARVTLLEQGPQRPWHATVSP